VLIHCAGGLGRTAMLAISVLLALGEPWFFAVVADRELASAGAPTRIASLARRTVCARRRGAMSALLRIVWLLVLGFRSRPALLLDQGCQGLTEWKLVSDGLDNVLQFIFATRKNAFFVARRKGEIERVVADRVPREALFQEPIFVAGQDKREVANAFSHSSHPVNRKLAE